MHYRGYSFVKWADNYFAMWATSSSQHNGAQPPPYDDWLVFLNQKGKPLPARGYFAPNLIYGNFRISDARDRPFAIPRVWGEHEFFVYATFPITAGVDGRVLRGTDWVPVEVLPQGTRDGLLARLPRAYELNPAFRSLTGKELVDLIAPREMTPLLELSWRGAESEADTLVRVLRALGYIRRRVREGAFRLGTANEVALPDEVIHTLRMEPPRCHELLKTPLPESHASIEVKITQLTEAIAQIFALCSAKLQWELEEAILSKADAPQPDSGVAVLRFTMRDLDNVFDLARPLLSTCPPIVEGF